MQNGTVKWFDDKKGFGFIAGENGEDYFVHYSDIAGQNHRTLDHGQCVVFTVGENRKGKIATNVVVEDGTERSAAAC